MFVIKGCFEMLLLCYCIYVDEEVFAIIFLGNEINDVNLHL